MGFPVRREQGGKGSRIWIQRAPGLETIRQCGGLPERIRKVAIGGNFDRELRDDVMIPGGTQ
jgi:hypothetical protein